MNSLLTYNVKHFFPFTHDSITVDRPFRACFYLFKLFFMIITLIKRGLGKVASIYYAYDILECSCSFCRRCDAVLRKFAAALSGRMIPRLGLPFRRGSDSSREC